jgi:large subunit ribosomal protein L1
VAEAAPTTGKKKKPGVPPRRGKKLRNLLANQQQRLAKDGPQPLKRAVQLLKQMKRAKFDETVEVHMWLGADTTQSDQLVRGSVVLPHGLGKTKRVVVFCQGDNVAKAKEAGAEFAGSADLIEKIQKENWLDFDVAIATQDMMGQVSRLGKVLGPRGLMPTPKAGTVVPAGGDVASAVREFKAGKVEYRTDKGGSVHAGVGKLSFDEQKIADNVSAFVDQIRHVRPSAVKGNYIKSVTLSATMSPGILLQV